MRRGAHLNERCGKIKDGNAGTDILSLINDLFLEFNQFQVVFHVKPMLVKLAEYITSLLLDIDAIEIL